MNRIGKLDTFGIRACKTGVYFGIQKNYNSSDIQVCDKPNTNAAHQCHIFVFSRDGVTIFYFILFFFLVTQINGGKSVQVVYRYQY